MDGEVKQNVLGRCPEGKMQYTLHILYGFASGNVKHLFGDDCDERACLERACCRQHPLREE